jgi:uroporphyrinogen-III decarboxylase
MERGFYLELAARGRALPIGVDLVLHERADAAAVAADGARLGAVLAETARRFDTPLALPHMDLELEKLQLLTMLGVPAETQATYHFSDAPTAEAFDTFRAHLRDPFIPRLQAHIDSIRYIAEQTDLVPVGMAIGPFSLMTKLVPDPITPIAMAGAGMSAEDDPEIACIEQTLELGLRMILHSVAAQIDAGAQVIFIAEPAANRVYLSPNQIEAGSDIYTRFVMAYNRALKAYLDSRGVDLFFHCCGELTDEMVRHFASLDPAVLSLGSSRKLWEDARLVSPRTVLYGNLPSKQFYSDGLITVDGVRAQSEALTRRMCEVGHPFILGTECDVLSVPGCEATIARKVAAMAECVAVCAR